MADAIYDLRRAYRAPPDRRRMRIAQSSTAVYYASTYFSAFMGRRRSTPAFLLAFAAYAIIFTVDDARCPSSRAQLNGHHSPSYHQVPLPSIAI